MALGVAIAAGCANLDGLSGGAPDASLPDASKDGVAPGLDGVAPGLDATREDGATDAGAGDADADATVTCQCPGLPSMWTYVETAKGLNQDAGCAADQVPIAYYIGAFPNPNACACKLKTMSPARCDVGDVQVMTGTGVGGTTDCPATGVGFSTNGGNCVNASGTVSARAQVEGPEASGGSCTAEPANDPSQTDRQAYLGCLPQTCDNLWCSAAPPPSTARRSCIIADGDQACPASVFTNKQVVSTSFDLDCASCTCIASAVCSGQSVSAYAKADCQGAVTKTYTTTCAATGGPAGTSLASFRYSVTTEPTYYPGFSLGTVTLGPKHTLCCTY